MTADVYAEWLRRRGLSVIRTTSSLWYSEGFGVYQAFPYHILIQPPEKEIADLFARQRAIALRYCAPAEGLVGRLSYHIAYDQPSYSLEDLGHRTRKNVRRGLRNCTVGNISFERLAEQGWPIHLDTLSRQGRRLLRQTREQWREGLFSTAKLPGFEVWGATVGEELVAYIITFQLGDACYILDQKSDRNYLELNVNNALTFSVTQTLVARPEVRIILYAMQSLDAPTSVEDFKYHMGYVQRPIRQCILFHPCASPFVNSISHFVIRRLSKMMPTNRYLSKAEGMMRIYLEQPGALAGSPNIKPIK